MDGYCLETLDCRGGIDSDECFADSPDTPGPLLQFYVLQVAFCYNRGPFSQFSVPKVAIFRLRGQLLPFSVPSAARPEI